MKNKIKNTKVKRRRKLIYCDYNTAEKGKNGNTR